MLDANGVSLLAASDNSAAMEAAADTGDTDVSTWPIPSWKETQS
jgi:hypothetical protein